MHLENVQQLQDMTLTVQQSIWQLLQGDEGSAVQWLGAIGKLLQLQEKLIPLEQELLCAIQENDHSVQAVEVSALDMEIVERYLCRRQVAAAVQQPEQEERLAADQVGGEAGSDVAGI